MSPTKKAKEFIDRYGLPEYLLNPVVFLLLEFKIEVLETFYCNLANEENRKLTKLPNLTEIELLDFIKETPTNARYINQDKENIV